MAKEKLPCAEATISVYFSMALVSLGLALRISVLSFRAMKSWTSGPFSSIQTVVEEAFMAWDAMLFYGLSMCLLVRYLASYLGTDGTYWSAFRASRYRVILFGPWNTLIVGWEMMFYLLQRSTSLRQFIVARTEPLPTRRAALVLDRLS